MKKIKLRAIPALLSILMLFAVTVCAYADEYTDNSYEVNVKDDISIYLPESWDIVESHGGSSGVAAYAYDEDENMCMNMYYSNEELPDDRYVYINDYQSEAVTYYEDYGKHALSTYFDTEMGSGNMVLQESGFFSGEWNSFITVKAQEKDGRFHLVYLTARMTDEDNYLVHTVLDFYKNDNIDFTDEETQLTQEISDSFYDFNYYNTVSDVSSGDDIDFGVIAAAASSLLLPLLIVVVIVWAAVKSIIKRSKFSQQKLFSRKTVKQGSSKELSSEVSHRKNTESRKRTSCNVSTGRHNGYNSDSSSAKQRSRYVSDNSSMKQHDRYASDNSSMKQRGGYNSDSENRYIQSLETLRKSGLLTKQEMEEMISKHKRL